MPLQRMFRHFLMTHWRLRGVFSKSVLQAIESAIATAEKKHGGEIRFVVEGELHTLDLMRGLSPRARAVQLFGQLGVWDTEHNNGVLIYVLLADRDVEIIADRGYAGKISDAEWTQVCHEIEKSFSRSNFERGVLDGIAAVSALIAPHYPAVDRDELSNTPVLL